MVSPAENSEIVWGMPKISSCLGSLDRHINNAKPNFRNHLTKMYDPKKEISLGICRKHSEKS